MVSARSGIIGSFAIVAIVGLPALLLGIDGKWHYAVFYELKLAFAICLSFVALMAAALYFLCRAGRRTATFAALFTTVWVLLLLPETQYYLGTRDATENSIVEPFHRRYESLGYILALLPVPFVLFGFWRGHSQTI